MTVQACAPALRAKIGLVLPDLDRATARVWAAPDPRLRYGEYLCTMHAVLRATTSLLDTGVQRCRQLAADPLAPDPLAARLADYLVTHAQEERGHDAWLLEDLETCGFDAAEPLRRLPSPQVARLVGAQYYWILHHHPVCLLGYIAVLEGEPPGPELAARLAVLTGLPSAGFRTVRRHALLDPGHRDRLDALIAELPLTAAQQASIALSALHTVSAVSAVFADLAARIPAVPRTELAKEGQTDGR